MVFGYLNPLTYLLILNISHLMQAHKLSFEEAYDLVEDKRDDIDPN